VVLVLWRGVLIYPRKSLVPTATQLFQGLLSSSRVVQLYLDELDDIATLPLTTGIVRLVVEPPDSAPQQAKQLLQRCQIGWGGQGAVNAAAGRVYVIVAEFVAGKTD